MEQNWDVDVQDGGYVEGVLEVVQLLSVKKVSMVPPFLLPISLPLGLYPSTLDSTKRSPILHLLFDFFCASTTTLSLII